MNRSGIITLMTDFGLSDAYVAVMKGVILSINRNAYLIDVTHNINMGSIFQGAGILKETFSYFSEGTVHVAVVDPGVGSSRRPIALKANKHYFVGPDNGIFWPIIEEYPDAEIVELTDRQYFLPDVTSTFHGRDIFAPVAAHISKGADISKLGPFITDPVKLILPLPYKDNDALKGEITHIDNFGNLITNITASSLNGFLNGKNPEIQIGKYKISKISHTYSDKEQGELIALINSSNYLEIAVNMGKASKFLGKVPDEIIGMRVKVVVKS